MDHFTDKQLPFIVFDHETNTFSLTQEAQCLLNKIEGPIGLIAVAGMYRTGKSYLLNRMLLDRSDGFGVGPTINPCTKGLWIWGRPIQGQTLDGDPISVLIVDTEGLGALDEDSNHDVRIFSLAILLSSYFLYNSVGSIDESALSNLSLVINLSKNIQIKANSNTDQDIDQLADYFPQFMWVVRDFTLQLVDKEGDQITSKEYLDKALEIQKGFSDQVEQKNRIRRLLTSFFKDRDCQTIIRPLTNEDNLQNLGKMNLSQLRPDFVEQVIELRKKVLNRVKPKMLNGKNLSGAMLCTLAESYVHAINNGAVPNIESAWSYICKQESQKAMDEAILMCQNAFQEFVIPEDEENVKQFVKDVKRQAIDYFSQKALGETKNYIDHIKNSISQMAISLLEENSRASLQSINYFLKESYSLIERKMKTREFKSFNDFTQELFSYQSYCLSNSPLGPNRSFLIQEFVTLQLFEAASIFINGLHSDLKLTSQLQDDQIQHLHQQLAESKKTLKRDRDLFEQRLSASQSDLISSQASESILKERLLSLQTERSQFQRDHEKEVSSLKHSYARETQALQTKIIEQEQLIGELHNKLLTAESDQERDNALLKQKVVFLEEKIRDMSNKDKERENEIKFFKTQSNSLLKDMQAKHDQVTRDLQAKLDEAKEKLIDNQCHLESLEQKTAFERQTWLDQEISLKSYLSSANTECLQLQHQLNTLKDQAVSDTDSLLHDFQLAKEQSQLQILDLESSLQAAQVELKTLKNSSEKEIALYKQKLQFNQVVTSQLQSQLDESKKQLQQTISLIEEKQQQASKVQQVVDNTEQLRVQMEKEIQGIKQEHQSQIEEITASQQAKYGRFINSLEEQIEKLREENQSLSDQLQSNDKTHNFKIQNLQNQYKLDIKSFQERIAELEEELESTKLNESAHLQEIQIKSEESLSQLRIFYEQEKERLDYRLAEERDRFNIKMTNMQDDYEARIRSDERQHEEEVEILQEEIEEAERKYQGVVQQLEHENAMITQKCEQFESQLKDKQGRLANELQIRENQMEAQIERFNTERKEMSVKIDQLNHSINSKERDLTVIKAKYDQLQEDHDKRRVLLDTLRQQFTNERQKLLDKIDILRQNKQEFQDEQMQRSLEDSREIALFKQRSEFQEQKISDLQKLLEDSSHILEERLNSQRQEFLSELQDQQQRHTQTRDQLEAKYENKRRQFKDQEQILQKQLNEAIKEKAILEEKLSSIDVKNLESKSKVTSDIQALKAQIAENHDVIAREREAFMFENERASSTIQELEKQLSDIEAQYDKDRVLWENQFAFLQQQKDQAKSDQQESAKKFEAILEQLQKRGSAEKDKFENSHAALINSVESKYKLQLKEQTEQYNKEKADQIERIKSLDKDNRALQGKIQIEQKERQAEISSLQKKVTELIDIEGRMQMEIEELKGDRDRRMNEWQRNQERERDAQRIKMNEIESKCKELESKRSAMVFDFEKEKSKWSFERDQLIELRRSDQDQVERLQKKNEELLKENERLKVDRNQKKIYQPISNNVSTFSKLTKFGKENNMAASQIQAPGTFMKQFGEGEKPDPYTLPFSREANSFAQNIRARMGSPTSSTSQLSSGFIIPSLNKVSGNQKSTDNL